MDPKNQIKLHYFPDIPLDGSSDQSPPKPNQDQFQPIQFNGVNLSSECAFNSESKQANEQTISHEALCALEQRAYERGFKEGELKGHADRQQELDQAIASCHKLAHALSDIKHDLVLRSEQAVVQMALALSQKIVRQQLTIDKDNLIAIMREALKRIVDHEEIRIRVHPVDHHFVQDSIYRLKDRVDNLEHLIIEADDSMKLGGCIVETKFGDIDAAIGSQLEALAKPLEKILHDRKNLNL
jgi:flagellar assembly protein FliH